MILRVETWTVVDGKLHELEAEFNINLYRHEGRKKLARHSWWAAHNGRAVVTFEAPVRRVG